jgi:hypothetical protein
MHDYCAGFPKSMAIGIDEKIIEEEYMLSEGANRSRLVKTIAGFCDEKKYFQESEVEILRSLLLN